MPSACDTYEIWSFIKLCHNSLVINQIHRITVQPPYACIQHFLATIEERLNEGQPMRLNHWIATIPFLVAGAGAIFFASILLVKPQAERVPFAYVTYEESSGRKYDLHVIDFDTGALLFESIEHQYDCPHHQSPDGKWLLYGTSPDGWSDFHLLNLETGVEHFVGSGKVINVLGLSNEKLIYTVELESDTYPSPLELYHYDLATEDKTLIATFRGEGGTLTIEDPTGAIQNYSESGDIKSIDPSIDGMYVYVRLSNDSGLKAKRYVLNRLTGNLSRIEDYRSGGWDAESSQFKYFDDWQDDTYKVYDAVSDEIIGYELPNPYSGESHIASAEFSPNRQYIAYKVHHAGGTKNESFSLHILDIASNEMKLIQWYMFTLVSDVAWIDDTRLVYAYQDADLYREISGDLFLYDVNTGKSTQLTDTPDIAESLYCLLG